MKMTIYLPDDLATEVRAEDGINISATCQDALREELRRRTAMAVAIDEGGFERVEVHDGPTDRYKAFRGRLLVDNDDWGRAYLTPKGGIAVYWPGDKELCTYKDYDEFDRALRGEDIQIDVARALGLKIIDELDI